MENIQILKYCPWISEEVNVKEYFEEYNNVLDEINGNIPHNEKINKDEALLEFFQMPEDPEVPSSRRSTPALSFGARSTSIDHIEANSLKGAGHYSKGSSSKSFDNLSDGKLPLRSRSANDIESSNENAEQMELDLGDPFCLEKMEADCNIDQLTVDGELPPRDICETGSVGDTGRVTNWYAGAFMDGVIPDDGPEKLKTLACQAKELYNRETIKDFTRLRHRLLKYSTTVRMVMKQENYPENITAENSIPKTCLRDIVFNVRIQRPYHKKTYNKKGLNRYTKYSQEMYLLGSQKLTVLRDAINCINDVYVHEDMSENPDPSRNLSFPSSECLFRSSFFYVNGVFYSDMRDERAIDNSITLKNWAKRYPLINKMRTEQMADVTFSELKLRLGYPYVYQHLGNCEHLITFTDVRLHHCTDIQDPSKYPLSRGNPVKHSVFCRACNLYLASWIIKDEPRISTPYTHLCDQCLKTFCYDDEGKKLSNFKLFPFVDEFSALKLKQKRRNLARNVQIKFKGPDGQPSNIVIEPFVE